MNAKKVSTKKISPDEQEIQILVWGNHEWGLVRKDAYDVFRWLLRRFAKDCPSYAFIESIQIATGWDETKKEDTALYTIVYAR